MTDGVTTNLSVRLTATDLKTPPVGGLSQQVNEAFALALAAGTGVGKADILLTKAINIAASGNTTVDLVGALDAFGAAIAIADVQVVMVVADATNTNDIIVGGGIATAWVGPFGASTDATPGTYNNPTIAVHPGGLLLMADPKGFAVVATTGDILKLANSSSGSAVTGHLIVIGRSA